MLLWCCAAGVQSFFTAASDNNTDESGGEAETKQDNGLVDDKKAPEIWEDLQSWGFPARGSFHISAVNVKISISAAGKAEEEDAVTDNNAVNSERHCWMTLFADTQWKCDIKGAENSFICSKWHNVQNTSHAFLLWKFRIITNKTEHKEHALSA